VGRDKNIKKEVAMNPISEQESIQFEPLVDTINADYYGGRDISRAFVHWAMKEILAAQELTADILQDQTMIGGTGDCGIDGWWYEEDQEPPVLHIFQGKYGNTELSESEIDELWRGPANLFEPLRTKNDYAIQLARDITRWLQVGVTFNMHYVTNCPIGRTANSRAATLEREDSYSLSIDGKRYRVPVEFSLCHRELLTEVYSDHLRAGWQETPRFTLHFRGDESHSRFAEITLPDTGAKTLSFLCKAEDIANIFAGPPKLWSIFKENPRGPLQRQNRQILNTLKDANKKGRFHALNNGLSIVCDSYEISADRTSVDIDGLRIVNGCQTTVTLEKALSERDSNGAPCLDDSVLVLVRLTKTTETNFRMQIAEANNTQKAVRSVDLSSLQNELRHYHQLFQALRPNPYFLEVQAGDWDYMTTRDEKRPFGNRYIERESLAQAVMAFQGQPSEAMEQRRYIFLRTTGPDGDPRGHFEDVFGRKATAEQLLLPWLIMKRIGKKVEEAGRMRREAESADEETNPLHNPDCLRYSGLYRTWLFSLIIGRVFRVDFSNNYVSPAISKNLCERIDQYFDEIYPIVDETVYEAIEGIQSRLGDEFEGRRVFRLGHTPFQPQVGQQTFVPRDIFRDRLTIVSNRAGMFNRAKQVLEEAAS
jgi:hypothetical protein